MYYYYIFTYFDYLLKQDHLGVKLQCKTIACADYALYHQKLPQGLSYFGTNIIN